MSGNDEMLVVTDEDGKPRHTFLPWCWVCGRHFGPNLVAEDHHIIPRAYGGVDGPQVRLCSDHHTGLHEVGKRIYANKPYHDLLSGNSLQDKKLVYLGTVACNARLATENDPNKTMVVVLSLTNEHKKMLEDLKKVTKARSRAAVFLLSLESLHKRHFV